MSQHAALPQGNPFASRWVRPGALPYLFPRGEKVQTLVERLQTNGWWGQIVGPHGSGKSTLLASLLPELERTGRKPRQVALHDGQRRLPSPVMHWIRQQRLGQASILVIDGYEQLSYLSRLCLKCQCGRLGMGLLATSHQSVGLPNLYRTAVTVETAQQVVAYLLAGRSQQVNPHDLCRQLAARSGNLREALFDLYDWYERLEPRG